MNCNRVFLIVLDSVGIGELPDADLFGDKGSHTLRSCYNTGLLDIPNLIKLGLYNIDNINVGTPIDNPKGIFGKMTELSKGKDTTIGHWEIAGIISNKPLPTYPNGFPDEIIEQFEKETGRKVLCNKPYSGTKVIEDYGEEHIKTGDLIVYTSADSVFQIAAHEEIIPVKTLYEYCKIARRILCGKHSVGRVIARPFAGEKPFYRTSNRHDFSLSPFKNTMLDYIKNSDMEVIAVGKINDIFNGQGITESIRTKDNNDGMINTIQMVKKDFKGLCFVNLVDFDMMYGHRNDVLGYTRALNDFDKQLGELITLLKDDDVLIITADHGCDPSTPSTDHSREYTPIIIYNKKIKSKNLGVRKTFADIGATVLDVLGIDGNIDGLSIFKN